MFNVFNVCTIPSILTMVYTPLNRLDALSSSCGPQPCTASAPTGRPPTSPDTLKATQAELTEQFRTVDEVAEDVIGSWLDENPRPATANQIATGIHWTLDSRSVYRITTVLKQLGYTRTRVRGDASRTWMWTPPDGPAKLEL